MTVTPSRRAVLAGLAAAPAFAGPARAQATPYPARPVRVVVPFGPGGVADITVRIVTEKLVDQMGGARFVIENMPSAGGIVAGRTIAGSDPDGYSLILLTNGTAVSVNLFKKLPFDPQADFVPVSTMGTFDFLFAVNKASGIDSIATLLTRAKEKPGSVNVATVAVGSTQHLASVLFNTLSGAQLTHVPFRSTPEALTALIRRDVDLLIDSQAAIKSGLEGGEVVAIASSGPTRSPLTPTVPTVAESGVPGYAAPSWNALFAPKGTPDAIVSRLNEAVRAVLGRPDVAARLADLGIVATPETRDALRERLRADIERWRGVIEQAGIAKQ